MSSVFCYIYFFIVYLLFRSLIMFSKGITRIFDVCKILYKGTFACSMPKLGARCPCHKNVFSYEIKCSDASWSHMGFFGARCPLVFSIDDEITKTKLGTIFKHCYIGHM